MKKTNGMAKRIVAAMLSAMMLCSSVQITVAAPKGQQTVTLGRLLAQNYGAQLSDRAKALLTSGYLADDATYSFTAPDAANGDGLVTVDPESKTVEAAPYYDGNNTWAPASAAVMVDGTEMENVALTADNGVYKGVFDHSGASYGVAVTYELYSSVDATTQNRMMEIPGVLLELKQSLINARNGADGFSQLLNQSVEFNLDSFYEAVYNTAPDRDVDDVKIYEILAKMNPTDGGGIPMSEQWPDSKFILSWNGRTDEEFSSLKRVTDDMRANDTETNPVKLTYCQTLGSHLQVNLQGNLDIKNIVGLSRNANLKEESNVTAVAAGVVYATVANQKWKAFSSAVASSALSTYQSSISELAAFDWTRVSGAFRNDLTDDQSAEVDTLVNALTSADSTAPTAQSERLLLQSATVTATVSQATVRVAIDAEVYPDGASSSTPLSDATTLFVGTGTDVSQLEKIIAQLEEIIAQQGIETAAIEQWNDGTVYSLGVENYTRTVTLWDSDGQQYKGQLEADHTYTLAISYTPKTYQVTAPGCGGDIANDNYPYGYTLRLPGKPNDANHVYDYTVNGQPYDQGDTVRVTEDTTITRRVGKAWEKLTWGQVVAEAYLSANPQAASVLTSDALHTGAVRWRYPSSEDLPFSGRQQADGLTLFAQTFAADESATRLWKPVSIAAFGAEVAFEKTGSIYQAELSGKPDDFTASYELALSFDDISQEAAQELVDLPAVLSANATRQLGAMKKLADQEGNLEEVGKQINQIRSTILGDEDIHNGSKVRINKIYEECTGKDASGGTYLFIYEYVKEYNQLATAAEKLAYYYQNYGAIYDQVNRLYTYLTGILEDEVVLDLLQTEEATAEYYEKLDEAVAEGTASKADLIRPDSRIDTRSASLTDLTARILAVEDAPQVSVTAPPTLSAAVSVSAGALLPLDCSGIAAFGKCGDTLYWTLDELGCLTIFGEGGMADYASARGDYAPWHVLADRVQSVFITSAAVPAVSQEAFLGVNAQVYYPDMAAWEGADLVDQNLGGILKWHTCDVGHLAAPGSDVDDVDVRDMAALFTYLSMGTIESTSLRTAPALFEELADVNRDGSVNILDYQVLYQQILYQQIRGQ